MISTKVPKSFVLLVCEWFGLGLSGYLHLQNGKRPIAQVWRKKTYMMEYLQHNINGSWRAQHDLLVIAREKNDRRSITMTAYMIRLKREDCSVQRPKNTTTSKATADNTTTTTATADSTTNLL